MLNSAKPFSKSGSGTRKTIENKVFFNSEIWIIFSQVISPLIYTNKRNKSKANGAFSILIDGGPLNHGLPETAAS
jgi:hypothetical protein